MELNENQRKELREAMECREHLEHTQGVVEYPESQDPDWDDDDEVEVVDEEDAGIPVERKRRASEAFPSGGGDLAEFFGDTDPKQQISICRAYASYLTAQNRARKPGKPRFYAPRK